MMYRVLRGIAAGLGANIVISCAALADAPPPPFPPPPGHWLSPMGPLGFLPPAPFFGPPPGPGPVAEAHGKRPAPRDICLEDIAREAAFRGYIEAKLNLAPAQQPLWQRVDEAGKAAAEATREMCATLPAATDAPPPTLPQAMAIREGMLAAQLAELRQVRPAMAALYEALSLEQRAALDPPGLPPRP